MMASAQEFADREAASWSAFEALARGVPTARRDEPGVVGDWSPKVIVWHCAHWSGFAADHLEREGDGPYTDPFAGHTDEHWDEVNDQIAIAAGTLSWEAVWMGASDARERLRRAIMRPGLPPEPIDSAAEESWIHYNEHAEHLRAFLGRPSG